ncbi:hypothetical protein [Clostridium cavendishii]|nr:hypothetical protein [Clostridium cavendishii]
MKKNGEMLTAKIDTADLDKVKSQGSWFAEWNKDFNNYLVQNICMSKTNKKSKPLKQSLHALVLDTNPKAPIKHLNGDTLDNRKCNLEIVERNSLNEYEKVDADTLAIILNDKLGNPTAKALISKEDKSSVESFSWVIHKQHNDIYVVCNTPEGRLHLDNMLMEPKSNEKVHHINLNPLDNRRSNLENKEIEE